MPSLGAAAQMMRRWLTTTTSTTNVNPRPDPPGHLVERRLVERAVLRERRDLGNVGLRPGLVADLARLLVQLLFSHGLPLICKLSMIENVARVAG